MPSARLENRDVGIGVHANLGGDLEAALYDFPRGKLGVLHQRARRGQSVRAPGADGENPVVGLDDVAGAGDDEAVLAVSHGEKGLEPAQDAVAAPVLGQLDGRALQIAGIALQLLFELLEQRESVGSGAGKTSQQLAPVQGAHLLGVGFHDRLPDGDLPVPTQRDLAVASDRKDGGGPNALQVAAHNMKLTVWWELGGLWGPLLAPPSCI